MLGMFPNDYVLIWNLLVTIIVLSYKFLLYKSKKLHYFFFDFCYFGNLICYYFIFLGRDSTVLFHAVYAFSTGPMLCSVFILWNSLVLHDSDKISSLLLHILPAKNMWAIHWFGWNNTGLFRFEIPNESLSFGSFGEFYKNMFIVYGSWLIFYYIIIFHIKKSNW